VQWAILGTGEPKYHQLLSALTAEFPDKVQVRLEFSDPLAHQIEAGSDLFLMPSRYEPCGLNQLYSLKYGAVPVVHATGGLADTIVDATPENLATGSANGFSFARYEAAALEKTLERACETYRHDRRTWEQLVTTGMRQDWSWAESARKYVQLYETTISRTDQTVLA
jgi:starch synthase